MNICIVAHLAYGAITGGRNGHAGGVEYQTSTTARWLAERGHRVSLLTWNEGRSEEEHIDGVHVIKMCGKNEGMRGVRFFHPKWTSLNRAMKQADAELYYHNCAEYVTGQVALWCRLHGRRFVYSVARDTECELVSPDTRKFYVRWFYRYGLRRADRIIVQTHVQQQMLLANFGLESVILPMPGLGPSQNEKQTSLVPNKENGRVLWVGRIDKEKRLEFLLDIAEALPNVNFDVAGKPTNPEDSHTISILTRAKTMPNVTLHGMVPRSRMPELYKSASLLCCTSLYEGFPNTFLEAWSYGLPIVSTYDPDNLIVNKSLGLYSNNKNELIMDIKTLLEAPEQWQRISVNARKYYEDNHALDPSMQRFEELFLQTLSNKE